MCYLQHHTYCIIKKSHAKWIHHFLRAKGNKQCHWVAVLLSAKVKWVYLNCTPFLRTQYEEDSGYRLFTMKLGNQLNILGFVEGISFQVRRYWGWKVVIVTVHNENAAVIFCVHALSLAIYPLKSFCVLQEDLPGWSGILTMFHQYSHIKREGKKQIKISWPEVIDCRTGEGAMHQLHTSHHESTNKLNICNKLKFRANRNWYHWNNEVLSGAVETIEIDCEWVGMWFSWCFFCTCCSLKSFHI